VYSWAGLTAEGEVAMYKREYVDIRGPHPIYVHGLMAVRLEGKPHTISVDDARAVVQKLLQ